MPLFDNQKTLYIIDGYGFIFRAFYAIPNLKTPKGEPIGAVYGFFKMLISLLNSAKPEYAVIALDTGKKTFRNNIYDCFMEKQAIKKLISSPIYKPSFDSINLTIEEIYTYSPIELINIFNLNKEDLLKICKQYNFDPDDPPKLLIIVIFLNLVNDIKIEDYKTHYKANRQETPEDLKSQFEIVRELINSMNIKTESKIGFEADDVICSIATKAVEKGFKAIIISADKDLCQLVENDKISVYDPMKKNFIDEQAVIKRFGVRADQICDYLSIVGDHCDNVIGINGIGPKHAIQLLSKYEHIDNILLHIDELDEKTKQKFLTNRETLELAYNLVKLCNDAIEIDNFEQYKLSIDHEKLNNFIQKYNFKTLDSEQYKNYQFYKKNNQTKKNQEKQQINTNDNQTNDDQEKQPISTTNKIMKTLF